MCEMNETWTRHGDPHGKLISIFIRLLRSLTRTDAGESENVNNDKNEQRAMNAREVQEIMNESRYYL